MTDVDISHMRVPVGGPATLAERATREDLGLEKEAGKQLRDDLVAQVGELQERLWAEDEQALLLVLQGMDTAGKDGTIRRVTTGVNPQGVRVEGFRAPSANERDRDYLWRLHRVTPRRGEIGIFRADIERPQGAGASLVEMTRVVEMSADDVDLGDPGMHAFGIDARDGAVGAVTHRRATASWRGRHVRAREPLPRAEPRRAAPPQPAAARQAPSWPLRRARAPSR